MAENGTPVFRAPGASALIGSILLGARTAAINRLNFRAGERRITIQAPSKKYEHAFKHTR
jgi:hypothetical protein